MSKPANPKTTKSEAVPVDSMTFDAVVAQVRTLADGGIRIQLDLSESSIDAATWLMKSKLDGNTLSVACVIDDGSNED